MQLMKPKLLLETLCVWADQTFLACNKIPNFSDEHKTTFCVAYFSRRSTSPPLSGTISQPRGVLLTFCLLCFWLFKDF